MWLPEADWGWPVSSELRTHDSWGLCLRYLKSLQDVFLSLYSCLCMCGMHACMYACLQVCGHLCMWLCVHLWRSRLMSVIHYILRQGLSQTQSSLTHTLSQLYYSGSHLCLRDWNNRWYLCGFWGSKLESSCLLSKHSNRWAISLFS